MNSSMSRPFEPNVLTVGRQFASRSSRRETRLPAQRWGIELEKGKALEVRDFAGMIMFLRVSGEGLLDAGISTSWREGGAQCYLHASAAWVRATRSPAEGERRGQFAPLVAVCLHCSSGHHRENRCAAGLLCHIETLR